VPSLEVVFGQVPEAMSALARPDAIFLGSGVTTVAVIDECWTALRPGGRLVVHALTLDSESAVMQQHRRLGGELARLHVEQAGSAGGFTAWLPGRSVVQWSVRKPFEEAST
jgi:precorrin-6Y C5,15-methyltransferase (decarboxylating)